MEKRLSVILACLFLCVGMVLAQNKISGTVVSAEDGEPVIGASVMIQGTKVGTVTDIDGKFTLSANRANPMLEISYIGMVTQKVKGSSNMKITLQTDSKTIDEVVVTGMVKVDKRLFSGSTSKIDASSAKIDGVADISRSLSTERIWYIWYSTKDSRAWCYIYLR